MSFSWFPGFVSTSLRLVITAQDLDVKQQEFIDGTLKSQIQAYTTYHDLSTPGSVGAFIKHVTMVYNLAVRAVELGSFIVTVQCFTLESHERLWNDYRSGCCASFPSRTTSLPFARIRMRSEKSNANHMSWYRISASFSAYEFTNGCGALPQHLHAHVWKHNERPEEQSKKVVAASI